MVSVNRYGLIFCTGTDLMTDNQAVCFLLRTGDGDMVMRLMRPDELLDEREIQALDDQALAKADRLREEQELAEAQDGAVDAAADESGPDEGAAGTESAINLALMEALLLSTHHPLTAGRLAELLDLDTTKPVRKAIKALNEQYETGGRAFRVEQVAGGFQILTLPEFGDVLKKLHQKDADAKLTKAALETLAIIAYKQPILRADVEAIRGCACGETIRSLMEKHLVKIAGRAEEPGRPILYGTTKRFLELFGLNNLRDLPQPEGKKPE
jgi:segregation and condensation protein B